MYPLTSAFMGPLGYYRLVAHPKGRSLGGPALPDGPGKH